jgi:cold shock CspA family protein
VFDAIFEINSPLKENFGKLSKNNFTYLIKNVVDSRNTMTHNMRDVTYTKNQLNSILELMRIFLYAFPFVYKFVECVILKKYKLLEKIHLKSNGVLTNKLNCSLIPLDEMIDVIDKTFQRNVQSGTVTFYDKLKGFGYVITSSGEEIRINQDNLEDMVEDGDKLEFEIKSARNGKEAVCIKVISE